MLGQVAEIQALVGVGGVGAARCCFGWGFGGERRCPPPAPAPVGFGGERRCCPPPAPVPRNGPRDGARRCAAPTPDLFPPALNFAPPMCTRLNAPVTVSVVVVMVTSCTVVPFRCVSLRTVFVSVVLDRRGLWDMTALLAFGTCTSAADLLCWRGWKKVHFRPTGQPRHTLG